MSHEPCMASEELETTSVNESNVITTPTEESTSPSNLPFIDEPRGGFEILNDGSVFVFSSPAMLRIREQISKIANFDLPVLILGESGSGKEVVARLIHSWSSRAQRRFLKVNCAALPETLLESELFGHERGAFTGATRFNPGKFQFCDSGTILLDEIGEMPPAVQAKLLHVLQDKTYSRLGAHAPISVDVRIIAATNVDILKALESGGLRKDLYYRLNTFVISVPPLRSRQEEIPLLLEHIIRRFATEYGCPVIPVSHRLMETCINYPWPGNIRELQSFVQRLLIQRDENQALQELQVQAMTTTTHGFGQPGSTGAGSSDLKALGRDIKCNAEREVIARTLLETRYRRKDAAKRLGISYKALLYKAHQYGLD
jgi:two-component system response regulator AtoC